MRRKNDLYYYNLEEVPGFGDLSNRVVIDWGPGARAYIQWYHNRKEIIQILTKGYLGDFPGLLNFTLDFEELRRLTKNPEANEEWKNHLSAVNGIYLILDNKTGNQYIGSASGRGGIWQRWSTYAKKPHGGNNQLMRLCQTNQNYHKHFHYSVLQTLPSNITQREITKIENLYKKNSELGHTD